MLAATRGSERNPLIAAAAIVQGMTFVAGKMADLNATERRLSITVPENDDSGPAPHARLRRCRNHGT